VAEATSDLSGDARQRASEQSALQQLLARFAKERRRRTEDTPADDDSNEYRVSPLCYPGLRSFDPSEDQFFFGRRRNVTEIRKKLAAERIVVVQGGSGTGKSSVIRAGLIPRLRDTDTMKGRYGNWYAAEFRPRTDPLRNLAEGLADLVARKFGGQSADLMQKAAGDSKEAEGTNSEFRSRVRDRLVNSFIDEQADHDTNERRARRAWALLNVLRDFAAEVDARDKLATDGLRAGPANLLLLVDQFEEVFRPEALARGAELLDLLIAAHAFLTQTPEGQACGLYIVVTMRTEELHRVGEYPALTLPRELSLRARNSLTLAEVVTSSFYLIQVMDPDQDRADLQDAIVQPAREVLDDYGLLPSGLADAPFDDGVVDWLLDGARTWRDASGQGHKADQLPLLQHALRAMWENALDRWNATLQAGTMPEIRITKIDLPRNPTDGRRGRGADLAYCLDARANRARDEAIKQFSKAFASDEPGAHSAAAGEAALRAAIRALARRDDRGNWARRFASIDAMDDFLAIDPDTSSLPLQDRKRGLSKALHVLKADGYVSEERSREFDNSYDISHEALIRNWGTAQSWLREPSDTAQAIERVLKEVDPSFIGQPDKAAALEELMPRQLVERLAPIEDPQSPLAPPRSVVCLPARWSKEQIRLVVGVNDERSGWGSDEVALEKLRKARRQVIEERQRLTEREERRRRGKRMLQIGLPAILVGVLAFIVLVLNRYQEVKEIAAGGWALGETGYVTSPRSLSDSNSLRAKGIATAQEYLAQPRSRPPPNRDELLKLVHTSVDFAARYTLGATLTPVKESPQTQSNVKAICWQANSPDGKLGDVLLGETGIRAELKIESGGAKLVATGSKLNDPMIAWDPQTTAPFRDASKLPPHGRICITVNGSTLIVATPSGFLNVLSLLWQTSSDRIALRGWPVVTVSARAPENGLACIEGVHESARGAAVRTEIIYKLYEVGDDERRDCRKAISGRKSTAFVRGLFTPVALSFQTSKLAKDTQVECREESISEPAKEPATWACGDKAAGRPIHIKIARWPTSEAEAGLGALLSLTHAREHEIFSGPFVIDVAVISPDTKPRDLNIALACHGGSMSLLISKKRPDLLAASGSSATVQSDTWAYQIGAKAVRDLLEEMSASGMIENEQMTLYNPLSLLTHGEDLSAVDLMLEASAKAIDAIQSSIAEFFYPPPAPLCLPASMGSAAQTK
jgi:hypothetical protein